MVEALIDLSGEVRKAMADQIATVSKQRLKSRLTALSLGQHPCGGERDPRSARICSLLTTELGIDGPDRELPHIGQGWTRHHDIQPPWKSPRRSCTFGLGSFRAMFRNSISK